jgi:hypothetical protein
MTSHGFEPATFSLIAESLNQLRYDGIVQGETALNLKGTYVYDVTPCSLVRATNYLQDRTVSVFRFKQ